MTWTKDPNDVVDYLFDWTLWLSGDPIDPDDTIASADVTAPDGLTVDTSSIVNDNTGVVARLSSGSLGETYGVQCRITTAGGQVKDRTEYVVIEEQ